MASKQRVGVLVAGVSVAGIAEYFLFTASFDRGTRAKIVRGHFVLVLETVILFFSRFVWTKLSSLFDDDDVNLTVNDTTTTQSTYINHRDEGYQRKRNDKNDKKRGNSFFGGNLPRLWRIFLLGYLFLCHFSYCTNLFFIGTEPAFISMLAYLCLGTFIHLNTGFLFLWVLRAFLNLIKINVSESERFWKKAAITYAIIVSMVGAYSGYKAPAVKAVEIPVRDLPSSMDGLRIVQLSDIHLGPTVGRTKLSEAVSMVNKLSPDVVVLTGDLMDGSVNALHDAAVPLRQLKSKYGLFYVTGNHEYYTGDVDNWFAYLSGMGFKVLHNENSRLSPPDGAPGEICLAGTDDIEAKRIGYNDHGMDLQSALGSCDPKFPTILLAHQPKAALQAFTSHHRVDVVLSGHTHGGQMLPMMIGAYFINPFFAGLYKYGPSSHVYVSMGTMYWGIPMRVLSTKEISVITLKRL